MALETKPKEAITKSKVAHYGGCPAGQIRDHNQKSKTFGKCIDVLAKMKKT